MLGHDFTNYDDPEFIIDNLDVQRGLTWANVAWAFTHPLVGNWHPVTTLSHMMDCQLYGLRAGGHHLTNLVLHLANTLLLFGLLRRMTGMQWRSVLVAALFALHPLHVESVAWVAERKDVLSTCFGLLTLIFYVRYAQQKSSGHQRSTISYLLALSCFALGLMSKAMLVTWPFVMLLLDCWPLRCFDLLNVGSQLSTLRRLVVEKLPFFLFSAVLCVATVWTQTKSESVVSLDNYSFFVRVENALLAYRLYLEKTFWPSGLAVFYPNTWQFPLVPVLVSAGLILAVCTLVIRYAARLPFLAFGWFWFLGTLIPVIGLVQVGSQALADRYSYIPLIGVFIMLVWGVAELSARWRLPKMALVVVAIGSLTTCAVLTVRQLRFWQNSETLFRHALAVTENNHIAHYNLGSYLLRQDRLEDAVEHFVASLRIRQDDKVMSNLGVALLAQGKLDMAIERQREALRMNPTDPITMGNLGVALVRKGDVPEAIELFRASVKLKPDRVETISNLAGALALLGKYDEAIPIYESALVLRPDFRAIRLNYVNLLAKARRDDQTIEQCHLLLREKPDDAAVLNLLGHALAGKGRYAEAVEQYNQALRLSPDLALAHNNLAEAMTALGRKSEAKPHYLAAIAAKGDTAETHHQLGEIYLAEGDKTNAVLQWREAVRLNPNSTKTPNNLAWVLATDRDASIRNGAEAVKLAENCARLTESKNSSILDTLAAAYAEAGKFAEAVTNAQQALDLATAQGDTRSAAEIRTRLETYKSGRPYRE